MLIIQKKRILIIITSLIISTFAFQIRDSERKEIIETVALPVNNKVIIIDAGHGGEDGGATADNRNIRSRY